jgi:hypothetical protein
MSFIKSCNCPVPKLPLADFQKAKTGSQCLRAGGAGQAAPRAPTLRGTTAVLYPVRNVTAELRAATGL